jgi:putative peptide zinc metalloprotease protein
VQLLGEAKDSGYREPPSLVRRADGQALHLTRLLYLVLEAADGTRSIEDIAAGVTPAFGRQISADNVRALIRTQLLPLGLLRLADGSEPEVKRADPLLGMRLRYTITDPARTSKLTRPFAVLFHPLIAAPVVAAFLAACWWLLMGKGLASATHNAFANPGLLLLVFLVTILSAGFHEFGHAAAAMRGGAIPGRMGAGLYLVWPAFFTDVTDSYRLGRGGRLRTDFGGLYFNAIVAVIIMGIWWLTHDDAWLLVIATQVLQMVRQLLPLLRFDGYHILADATGVPDLFQHIKPTLLGLLPWGRNTAEARALKPWARALITLWVMVTLPLLLLSLVLIVLALPRLLATAWAAEATRYAHVTVSLGAGDFVGSAAHVLAMAAIALPVLAILYMLLRLGRQLLHGILKRTNGNALHRGTALVTIAAILAGIAWAWWPRPETYRPVQPYDRGTLLDAVPTALSAPGSTGLVEGRQGATVALRPEGTELPTREKPQLALVLLPSRDAGTPPDTASRTTSDDGSKAAPSWVFPFDRPQAPAGDGNQALAVNTTDGSVVYDVAFALVWAEDGTPVETRNEAYAFASCTGCAAVAVGFQVVLVVGQANVVVPANLSAAANYNCVSCLTYALASQLVVLTLDGPLSTDGMARLKALWEEIAEFGRNLHNVPLTDIQARLNGYKEQIAEIIRTDPSASTGKPDTADPGTTSPPTLSQTPDLAERSTPPLVPAATPAGPDPVVPAPTVIPAPTTSGPPVPAQTSTPSPTLAPAG